MKTLFWILLLFMLMPNILFGQELYKEFELQQPDTVISQSLYNSIDFIDSRVDTSNMGIVQVGIMNNHAIVISKVPLSIQFDNFLKEITDSTAHNGQLLLQIRHFLFAESTSFSSEKGYCYLRANLFSRNDDKYTKIVSVDTLVLVKKMDVTNSLMKLGSKLITDMIENSLTIKPQVETQLSYNEILKVDSIEKRSLKVYNSDVYANGLYYNHDSFMNQTPDKEIVVKTKRDLSIASVSIKDDDNNLIKIQSSDFYAFVYEGRPYISTGYGYYPIYKNNDSFYFVGKIKPMTSNKNVFGASIMFGMIGGIIAANSSGPGENYFIIIDHNTGGFIQLRKMPSQTY